VVIGQALQRMSQRWTGHQRVALYAQCTGVKVLVSDQADVRVAGFAHQRIEQTIDQHHPDRVTIEQHLIQSGQMPGNLHAIVCKCLGHYLETGICNRMHRIFLSGNLIGSLK